MAANEDGNNQDFYVVLGLKKECSDGELRTAYKKLALKWHPDRCAASGNVEEAKKKFQAIQEAYSVLSDANKRLMYDLGVYDRDDDDDNIGMGDFLDEMAALMRQDKCSENVVESFEDLKSLFNDMFQNDLEGFGGMGSSSKSGATTTCSSSMFATYGEKSSTSNKRNFEMKSDVGSSSNFDTHFQGFSFGADSMESHRAGGCVPGEDRSRRTGRKQKVSSGHDVSSSSNAGISA